MVMTAPLQFHEVHFLMDDDAHSTLSERLSFGDSKRKMYNDSCRANMATNFCVAAPGHVERIKEYIQMLCVLHGSTFGILYDNHYNTAFNDTMKLSVSHSVLGWTRFLWPVVGAIPEVASFVYEVLLRLNLRGDLRFLDSTSPLLTDLQEVSNNMNATTVSYKSGVVFVVFSNKHRELSNDTKQGIRRVCERYLGVVEAPRKLCVIHEKYCTTACSFVRPKTDMVFRSLLIFQDQRDSIVDSFPNKTLSRNGVIGLEYTRI
jgi:hypothetical protein